MVSSLYYILSAPTVIVAEVACYLQFSGLCLLFELQQLIKLIEMAFKNKLVMNLVSVY